MIAALSYGAFELFISPYLKRSETNRVAEEEKIDLFAGAISSEIESLSPDEDAWYILEIAGLMMDRDPFYRGIVSPENEDLISPLPEETPVFVYSGFIELGETRLAVINGQEYHEGDDLPQSDFVLVSIEPGSVTLKRNKSQDRITVPYIEDDF